MATDHTALLYSLPSEWMWSSTVDDTNQTITFSSSSGKFESIWGMVNVLITAQEGEVFTLAGDFTIAARDDPATFQFVTGTNWNEPNARSAKEELPKGATTSFTLTSDPYHDGETIGIQFASTWGGGTAEGLTLTSEIPGPAREPLDPEPDEPRVWYALDPDTAYSLDLDEHRAANGETARLAVETEHEWIVPIADDLDADVIEIDTPADSWEPAEITVYALDDGDNPLQQWTIVLADGPEPEPDPDPAGTLATILAPRVARLLDRRDDERVIATARDQLPIVIEYVNAYVYGRGMGKRFGDEGPYQPEPPLAAVIVSATSRFTANPEQLTSYTALGYSERREIFAGFNLAEIAVLNRYRRRSQ